MMDHNIKTAILDATDTQSLKSIHPGLKGMTFDQDFC